MLLLEPHASLRPIQDEEMENLPQLEYIKNMKQLTREKPKWTNFDNLCRNSFYFCPFVE